MVQDLVGLGPQLARVVRRQRGQLAAQLVQRPAQRAAEHREQLLVAGGQRVVAGGLALQDLRVLLGLLLVRAAVGERHHRADQQVPVPHGRGRQVDGHGGAALRPQHLVAHSVLAAGLQGVGERAPLVRERLAVGARVQHQRVQLLAAEVAGAVAEDLRGGRVDQDDAALGVGADDTLRGRAQDHLGLPLRTGQLGLGVDGSGEVADDDHEEFVAGVVPGAASVGGGRRGVRVPSVLQVGAGHLDGELAAVGAPGHHPGRLGAALLVLGVGAAHRARDELGVEGGQQVEHAPPHEPGPRRLEHLQRDGVRVDDRAVAVDEHEPVRKGVKYGCEASSASGWPAAHDDASSLNHCTLRPVTGRESKGRGCASGGG